MELIFKSEKSLENIKKLRSFLLSDKWMAFLFAFAGLFTTLSALFPGKQIEIKGTLVFVLIIGACLVISDDIMAGLAPFMLTSLIAIKCYDSFDVFMGYKWIFVPVVFCILFHFIAYKGKWTLKGELLVPMVFVSVSILLGGLGFITLKEYFSLTSIYHMLGLGFAMVFVYLMFHAHIKDNTEYSLTELITRIMVLTGCFASFMVISYYLININTVLETKSTLVMQWRNNCSTILMIVMPFAFFAANKKTYATVLGFIFYFAILLTGSRGGMVFGSIEIVMCIVMYMLYDKRRRLAYVIICGCFLFGFLIFSRYFMSFLGSTVDRLFSAISGFLMGEKNEVRTIHYARGINDFLNNPIFGTGLGYMGNRDVHASKEFALCWYHCEPIQIAASFGIVGIAAYMYQFIRRNVLLWRRTTLFNITVFLSYISLEFMSLVNPGIFCPLPYLLMVTLFFVVVEKNEQASKENRNEDANQNDF